MVGNKNFHRAQRKRQDEFYTRFEDIENEIKHYKKHFEGRVVFCNCDDPKYSQFWKYFVFNFDELKLKKIISTHYRPTTIIENEDAYALEYNGKGKPKKIPLQGDGDFRDKECIDLLKQSDIVCTNPPFSLFRDYINQLMKYKKKFLVIGNLGAATYKEMFPLVQGNKMWFGLTPKSGDLTFRVPDDYTATSSRLSVDENGRKWMSQGTALWFTNLSHRGRNTPIVLYKRYNPEEYPKYDNYNAIEVSKVKNIPKDYKGEMGVPITFLEKLNPKQFKIIGLCRYLPKNPQIRGPQERFFLDGKEKFARIAIKHKKGKK